MTSPYIFLFPSKPYINLPEDFFGFLVWFVSIFLLFLLIFKLWQPFPNRIKDKIWVFYLLVVLAPIATLLGGFTFDGSSISGFENHQFILFIFAAIPWQIAAGLFGMAPAVIIALFSGISIAIWGTHDIFVIPETIGMAFLFSFLIRQNYRSIIFKLVRIPILAAIFTGAIFLPVLIFNQAVSIDGSLATRIDYSFSETFISSILRFCELVIAGLFSTLVFYLTRSAWFKPKNLNPTPIERKIENRFLATILPIILFVLIFVVFVDWRVAYSASKDLIETRLKGSAEVAAASLPYFFETGQSLLASIGEDVLINNPEDINHELANSVRSINYFSEIYIFNSEGDSLGGYPDSFPQSKALSVEEQTGIDLALTGVSSQIYSSMSSQDEKTILMTFISSVYDSQNDLQGVLVGRTVFETNPYVQPVLSSMNLSGDNGGEIFILDDQNRIIYHSNETQDLWIKFAQNLSDPGLFEDYSVTGESYYYYSQPLTNRSWFVVVGLPKIAVQDLALKIAAPLLWVLLFVIVLVVLAIHFSIHPITKTLQSLTNQAKLISQGELENSMVVESVDELGQLAFSFEQMRLRLKDRLDELKQLLFASQGVSKHLDIRNSIQPILQTSMGENVDCARVVLIRQVTADLLSSSYLPVGIGKENESIKSLDQQLFEMMQYQDILPIQNLSRFKRFVVPGKEKPGAILAIALHQENQYFGVFWVGYNSTKLFKEEEIQFYKTIASQAAMAASNAQLYSTAELGRQRFEAVLNSTPDPVMVFDEENRLILINPAAKQLGGIFKETEIGLKIKDVIEHQELLDLLSKDTTNRDTSREIYLLNRRVFFTTVSSVIRNDQSVGKVCLLRDITQYKEVDTFKSDIVSMVSHDLRSPLTLMRGYASMLQMVGEINEQQRSYIAKIVSGVDSMSKLVNNLLDLGRIEAGIGLKIDQLNPISIAEQVVYELQPHATQKNIELLLENDLNRDLVIEADSALLQQAIYNIVENALKYNSIGGKVKVNISSKNGFATYEISDNGIGIAPIDLPHLFEKFYRSGRREAYNQRGSGLGLAIVKSIIEKHNGKVWVESKLGRGSSFYIQLPTKQS